jgi:hypothetical protein
MATRFKSEMARMVLWDSTLESLTSSVNAPLVGPFPPKGMLSPVKRDMVMGSTKGPFQSVGPHP